MDDHDYENLAIPVVITRDGSNVSTRRPRGCLPLHPGCPALRSGDAHVPVRSLIAILLYCQQSPC
ncbi:MAG: hypothetical protein GX244_03315 [Firmicutes bacterium]|nr:hypothetical protein [Bacillota bacterium]